MIQLSRRTVALTVVVIAATLAIAITSLVRTADASHEFPDVRNSYWAHGVVSWAADNGIVNGYPNGTFRPNKKITRGETAAVVSNYNNTIELVNTESNPGFNTAFAQTATCPAGKRAVAGGGQTSGDERDPLQHNVMMTDSYPDTASSWTVRWEIDDFTFVNPSFVRAWALCVPNTFP